MVAHPVQKDSTVKMDGESVRNAQLVKIAQVQLVHHLTVRLVRTVSRNGMAARPVFQALTALKGVQHVLRVWLGRTVLAQLEFHQIVLQAHSVQVATMVVLHVRMDTIPLQKVHPTVQFVQKERTVPTSLQNRLTVDQENTVLKVQQVAQAAQMDSTIVLMLLKNAQSALQV